MTSKCDVTNFGRLQFWQMRAPGCRTAPGAVDVVLSYCHATLIDSTLLDLLPYFKEKGVGVISASVTSMGLFTKQARSSLDSSPIYTICRLRVCGCEAKSPMIVRTAFLTLGNISIQGPQSWHPAPPKTLEAAAEARAIAARHGLDIGTLAIKQALRAPGIAVHLIGMASPKEVLPQGNPSQASSLYLTGRMETTKKALPHLHVCQCMQRS